MIKNNLIGISGKMGSGKDTVGKMLQYLSSRTLERKSDYQIKKFADKLKDMVCLLIGCTREQLEDREFKEKELGEEWNKLDKIALLAYNKDNPLCHEKGYLHNTMTVRKLLQLLGTEAGREIIHPNIWVNALFADYKSGYVEQGVGWVETEDDYPNWIITDVRFPNEAKAIKDRGGIVIRINRLSEEQKIASIKARANRPNDAIELALKEKHPSETALDDYEFDHVIDNNGSIEELLEKVNKLNLV